MNRTVESLKAFVGIQRTSEILDRIVRKDSRKHGLNLNEFAVLELLLNKGPQPIQQIKEKILIASSSTTYLVDKLCDKGLVERIVDSQDRRVIYASLTPSGEELIERIFPSHAQLITKSFDKLDDEELEQLRYLLKKLNGLDN
ncbi:MarR family transcriptional regulator [Aerococcaceae bacterium DSM 111021]|nr:MarR family transcriptional regulator [Aerococcaceae bacterium DSM 111021]